MADLKGKRVAVTRGTDPHIFLVRALPGAVVDKQLKARTELTHSRIGAPQRESILAAGLALQQAAAC